jgi:phosphate acetyltransferase
MMLRNKNMKNKIRDKILNLGKEIEAQIILPEIHDCRVLEAKDELVRLGFNILSIDDYKENIDIYLDYIAGLPFTKNWPVENLQKYLENPVHLGMAMVACEDADGLVAGAVTSSSDIIRSAIRLVGIRSDSSCVSSIFLMIDRAGENALTFGDCAVIPEPDSKQLSMIAAESAEFHKYLTGEDPAVAFLSFSSKGSSSHYRVDKVKKAVEIFARKYPHIKHDGEIQFDAAIVPQVSNIKTPSSPLSGNANVFIFPNLDAGNIGYKIAQRIGGYFAWGPLLQGLKKPVHDLSRGCSVDDIINIAAITALQRDMYANI